MYLKRVGEGRRTKNPAGNSPFAINTKVQTRLVVRLCGLGALGQGFEMAGLDDDAGASRNRRWLKPSCC